jgi:hypothetical protein
MAITIVENLTATPNPTTIPKRVEFRQTLRSTLPAETITLIYSLEPDHDIWFEDAEGTRVKQLSREETVGKEPQVCVDRLKMVTGPGEGPQLTVEVAQAIRDSQGQVIPDLSVVQIAS